MSFNNFHKAILHIDGDAFFASCEVALNPELRGKPVVTGKERGIASSMTYELKRMGVTRGMSLREIQNICPDVIILPSDYETYSLFSKRMYAIVRRYTDVVEEYSIDECFADLTGLRQPLHMTYRQIAESIKRDVEGELGMTFSMGLGPNKVIAKIGSRWNKPSGLTIIEPYEIETYLRDLPVGNIWGIGPQTSAYLAGQGIFTALQYAKRPEVWIEAHMSKPFREIWHELHGKFIYNLNLEEKHDYQSISKTKTFTPPSSDQVSVFSQLSKNIENACIKARRHHLAARKIFFFLKTQEFRHCGLELTLPNSMALPHEIIRMVDEHFNEVYRPHTSYRATGIVLMDLKPEGDTQLDLFGAAPEFLRWRRVYATVDALDNKFGKHTVFLGSTHKALFRSAHLNERDDTPRRLRNLFKGENVRQRVALPSMGEVG